MEHDDDSLLLPLSTDSDVQLLYQSTEPEYFNGRECKLGDSGLSAVPYITTRKLGGDGDPMSDDGGGRKLAVEVGVKLSF